MSCEDCKNYEKKDIRVTKALIQPLMNETRKICVGTWCADCPIGERASECKLYQLWLHLMSLGADF